MTSRCWIPLQLLMRLSLSCLLLTVLTPHSSTAKDYTGNHIICRKKCGSSVDERTYKACMLHCRNYIELAMTRPRLNSRLPLRTNGVLDKDELVQDEVENSRLASDDERLETESDAVVAKRPKVRGTFVRIGRQGTEGMAEEDAERTNQNYRSADEDPESFEFNNSDNDDGEAAGSDVTKRKYGFVRIGRQKPEEFLRIGKQSPENEPEVVDKKAAFVRIGRKPANFVRIGRRKSGFVRIGKDSSAADAADDCKQDGGDGSCVEKRRKQAFVRIGK